LRRQTDPNVLQLDRRYFDMLMRLGARYRLPIRLCRGSFEWPFARISRALVARAGLVTADTFMTPPWGEPVRPLLMERIPNLPRGVTEVVAHPADDGEELRAYDTEYADIRAADAECLADAALCDLIRASGVTAIGFKPMRDAMRRSMASRLHRSASSWPRSRRPPQAPRP
jgi:hypothetical protein